MWATNMITIMYKTPFSNLWMVIVNIFMVIPIVWGLICLAKIAEVASIITCMCEIDLAMIRKQSQFFSGPFSTFLFR